MPPGADLHFPMLPQLLNWIKPKSQTLTGKQKPGGVRAPDLHLLFEFCTGFSPWGGRGDRESLEI